MPAVSSRRLTGTLSLLGGILAFPAPVAAQQAPERYTIAADQAAIFDLVGEVTVEAGTGRDLVIEVRRGGRDAARLTIQRGTLPQMPDFETLRVAFPGEDIVYPALRRGSRSTISWREDGTFGGDARRRRGRDWRTVEVSGTGAGLEAWADLRILVPAGRRLDVNLGVGTVTVSNVAGRISVDVASADVTAQTVSGSFDVDAGSGEVHVSDTDGELTIDTGSGDVDVTNHRGGRLSIDTGSGNVSATSVTADAVNIDTGSGSINLSGVSSSDVRLDTGSGDVGVSLTNDVSLLVIDTGSGSVELQVPPTLGAMLDIETGSGSIETELPLEVTRWGNDQVSGRIGDGNGRVEIETGSGRVRIVRKA